jgi:hypothetical protein
MDVYIYIIILLLVAQILSGVSNYIGRISKSDKFINLLIIACIASVVSTLVSFPTIHFLGKSHNVIIIQCMLIVGSVCSVTIINALLIKEPVHISSYITLGLIVIILIAHHILTKDFYSKTKKIVKKVL